jgi:hypothetical protein
MRKAIANTCHRVPSAICFIEAAPSIGEPTINSGELHECVLLEIERPHPLDHCRHFLTVGADVLHRRSTRGSWNTCKALKAGAIILDGALHKLVPVFAGCDLIEPAVRRCDPFLHGDSFDCNVQHQSIESSIGHEQVATSAKHKQRSALRARPCGRFGDVRFCLRRDKPPRRAADIKRRERRKRLVFFNAHRCKATPPRIV